MNIKICGNMEKYSVDAAVKYGASHVGFIMSAGFRRSVTVAQVLDMTVDVPKAVKKVGVFVNEPVELVKAASRTAKLDMIQLHGNEDMAYIRQLDLPVIKAVSSLAQAENYENVILLLDNPKGGSGQTFDWNSMEADSLKLPFFLAGGLTPENVSEAIAHFPNAYGLDISSGIETDGRKDVEKIKSFIENAK